MGFGGKLDNLTLFNRVHSFKTESGDTKLFQTVLKYPRHPHSYITATVLKDKRQEFHFFPVIRLHSTQISLTCKQKQ